MCFAGGGSSQATEIDPSIQAQQEADACIDWTNVVETSE